MKDIIFNSFFTIAWAIVGTMHIFFNDQILFIFLSYCMMGYYGHMTLKCIISFKNLKKYE